MVVVQFSSFPLHKIYSTLPSLNYHGNKFTAPCLVFKDEDVFRDVILRNSILGPKGTLINLLTETWVTKPDNGEYFRVPGTYQHLSKDRKTGSADHTLEQQHVNTLNTV